MTLLESCWFMIESIIIPDGFLKWFYLSFYIHPILLFLCQIFLWIKLLQSWFLLIVSIPIRIACFLASCILRFLTSWGVFLFSSTRLNHAAEVVEEANNYRIPQICSQVHVGHLYTCLHTDFILYELNLPEFQANGFKEDIANKADSDSDSVLHVDETVYMEEPDISIECLSSGSSYNSFNEDMDMTADVSTVCSSNSPTKDADMNVYLTSICSSNLPVDIEKPVGDDGEDESDSFYKKYTERMRWFDVINYDRTSGISAILNKQLGTTPSSFEGIEPADFSIPDISWSKMARKRLVRSLESDFELVYVGQSCLSWEALHHQYRKVEALACSSSENAVFYDNAAGKFQRFQVLLERFMEDERSCEGKRYWNYVQKRFSLKSLIQVPEVSGYMEEEKEGMQLGEAMRAVEVLKAIEKCIKTFWLYVKTDNKKPWWKVRSFSWTCPPVEDPRDLLLLADLTKKLQKKELWLKDLHGKKRCWLKRVTNPLGETQKKEMLFTMIDMKLVSRVLKMSMISTSQLKWCQEKLNNIEFKEGKVMRACTVVPCLFPSS